LQAGWLTFEGVRRVDETTQLLRQVHPNHIKPDGEVASIAFKPNDNDAGHLSVYDGDLATPEESHKHYIEVQKKKSAGVMAVTVSECITLSLPAVSSPLPDFDAHAHIDFTACDKKQERTKSKELLAFAVARQWLYRPEA
jgi:hypothetical protein